MKRLALALFLTATAGVALAAGDPPVPRKDTDPNNMPYGLWPTITAGTNYAGQLRGVAVNCTAAGTTTLTDRAGAAMQWTLAVGFQQQPFTPATFTAVSGCTFYGLKSD